MDETDLTPTVDSDAETARAAREWAEQRRAHARAQFETPSWIGPNRHPDAPEATAFIPEQADPVHDFVIPQPRSGPPIPDTAHWVEKAKPRVVAGVVLVAAIGGLITSGVLAITTQSPIAIVALVSCAFLTVIFRGALMSANVTTVDLKGSTLRVRCGAVNDLFNLADKGDRTELVGTPDQPTWRLRLEALDGRIVELGPTQVDAAEMHRIVEHYRAIADRDMREREKRYNR
jgi:hypothetical protein